MKTLSSFLFCTKFSAIYISLSIYALSARACEIDTVITAASSDYFDSLQVIKIICVDTASLPPDELNCRILWVRYTFMNLK